MRTRQSQQAQIGRVSAPIWFAAKNPRIMNPSAPQPANFPQFRQKFASSILTCRVTGAVIVNPAFIYFPFLAWKISPAQNVITKLSGSLLLEETLSGKSKNNYNSTSYSVKEIISQEKSMSIGSSDASEDDILTSIALLISNLPIPDSVRYFSQIISFSETAFVIRRATLLSNKLDKSGTIIGVLKRSFAFPSLVML